MIYFDPRTKQVFGRSLSIDPDEMSVDVGVRPDMAKQNTSDDDCISMAIRIAGRVSIP